MAYSEHLTSVEPWTFRPVSFLDPWFTDALSRDTETLTRALQQSLSSCSAAATPSDSNTNTNTNTNTNNSSSDDTTTPTPDVISPFLIPTQGLTAPVVGSNSFEIETASQGVDAPVPKQRQRNGGAPGVSSGKVAKRKSRSTKRSQTTFITADAANFRQMVQQVTGSRLGHSPMVNIGQILRPEPHRPSNRFPGPSNGSLVSSNTGGSSLEGIAGCLPTLDTSAFLLDRHRNQDHNKQLELEQEQQVLAEMVGRGSVDLVAPLPPASLAEEFDPFGCFPTLDSWNSM